MYSNVVSRFKYSIAQWCVTRRERVNQDAFPRNSDPVYRELPAPLSDKRKHFKLSDKSHH